jgi:hypothetical protein
VLIAAFVAVALGRPAWAQRVVLEGSEPDVTEATVKLNGKAQDPSSFVTAVKHLNSPSVLVINPNATFGYAPSVQGKPAATGFPLAGKVSALPDGRLELVSSVNHFTNGTTTGTTYVGGVVYAVNGEFHASLTLIETRTTTTPAGKNVLVESAAFALPLKFVSH